MRANPPGQITNNVSSKFVLEQGQEEKAEYQDHKNPDSRPKELLRKSDYSSHVSPNVRIAVWRRSITAPPFR